MSEFNEDEIEQAIASREAEVAKRKPQQVQYEKQKTVVKKQKLSKVHNDRSKYKK